MPASSLASLQAAALMLTFLMESSAMIRHFYVCDGNELERFNSQKIGQCQNLVSTDKLVAIRDE